MANALVCCGGTGAHVALAFMRLHALGHPLGCFRHTSTGKSLELPDLYLVDQDSGDGSDDDETAWQKLRHLIGSHPWRTHWGDGPGQQRPPRLQAITPLPVGPDHDWFNAPRDQLIQRFGDSDHLHLVASAEQQRIRYSLGMMGSPAVGSLLFRLKGYDRGADGFNHDRSFDDLQNLAGRIAVVGSAVGGTGSSVAPTLSRMLAEHDGADVMAVMPLRWFRLRPGAMAGPEDARSAKSRNRDMVQNASSGLQYYGKFLANSVATVPVGVPDAALVERVFAGDNQQPAEETYVHAVASLCCMLHYLVDRPYGPGLYHLGATDATRLEGGTQVPGGTLQSIANQGEVLERTARVLGETLRTGRRGMFAPPICKAVAKVTSDSDHVGRELVGIAAEYRRHLDWLYGVLGVQRREHPGLTQDTRVRGRIAVSPPRLPSDAGADRLAGALFAWTAEWVREEAGRDEGLRPGPGAGRDSYWPQQVKSGLAVSAGTPGELTRLPTQNVDKILEGFVDVSQVSQNGWPDPFASASHFHDAVDRTDPTAMRKLELLLAGLVDETLTIERLGRSEGDGVSIERMVEDQRQRVGTGLAVNLLVRSRSGGVEQIVGFTSPRTIFCPAPGIPDATWGSLWARLTGFGARTWKPDSQESWENQKWGSGSGVARQAIAWIDALKKHLPQPETPAWTGLFPAVRRDAGHRFTPFGAGTESTIHWGDRRDVPVFLPTSESGRPPTHIVDIPRTEDASAFLARHGTIRDEAGDTLFEVVEDLRLPADHDGLGRPAGGRKVRAVWKRHLDELQARGAIVGFWEERKAQQVHVITHRRDGTREQIVLVRTLMLDRDTIQVRSVVPLRQMRAPDQSPARASEDRASTDVLYPDLPLQSKYLDLAHAGGTQPRIESRQGGEVAVWELHLRGRGSRLRITVALTGPGEEGYHRAHWMVWPAFRTSGPSPWRAYYVYDHCTDRRLALDVLHRDPDDERVVRRLNPGNLRTSYPVSYDVARQAHTGGPPVAVSLRNHQANREHGLYSVQLRKLDESPARVSVGIDFGTSHSTAAVSVGGAGKKEELLKPELGDRRRASLSHHISENWEHVTAPRKDIGLLALSAWMPTYGREADPHLVGLVPTELLTVERVGKMNRAVERSWVPLLDYVIPPLNISRRDFTDHLIANFKWDTLVAFHGRERELRRVYLDRLVELVGAEVHDRFDAPTSGMSFTFTYPLRTPKHEVAAFQRMLGETMKSGSSSLGIPLTLTNGEGLFNESHAARVGAGRFPEVRVVGDLGGGTLDLFISAEGKPSVDFREVVDSVKVGGNLLLRTLAAELAGRMPHGWATGEDELAMQLAAWMRARGASRLFGRDDAGYAVIQSLRLAGFSDQKQKRRGRAIIGRYFYLVGEYIARSLAAYLGRHWHPRTNAQDHRELAVQLYLRGNGWRLWPGDEDYAGVEEAMAERVTSRLPELWRLLLDGESDRRDPASIPAQPPPCVAGAGGGHPKLDIVRNVVGRARADAEVRNRWLSYTLVRLRVLRPDGPPDDVSWHGEIPFRTGGEGAKVQLDGVDPPIPLSGVGAVQRLEVGDLPRGGLLNVNTLLKNADHVGPDAHDLLAPVGAYVWEEAFKSAMLRKGTPR